MKITIFGSCRQDSLYNDEKYEITKIKDDISYTHYTKEILEVIKFIKYNTVTPEETLITFRSPMLDNTPIYANNYKNDILTTDVFIIEIASKICYEYNNKYVHHILYDCDEYGNDEIKKNIIKRVQDDSEIENDILKIKEELNTDNIIIVGHIVTYENGERNNLLNLLEQICKKHKIAFINPKKEIIEKGYDIKYLLHNETILAHYNDIGHSIIHSIYDKYINSVYYKLDYLQVYTCDLIKERIGIVGNNNAGDGGYVIANGLNYDTLLSCGISDDIKFENAFLEKYNNILCYAFDGTINNLPKNANNNILFIKKNITNQNTETTTNLLNIIDCNDNIFLKMDIETNEYQWLETLTTDQLLKFKQIVIEFHFAFKDGQWVHELFSNLSFPISVEKRTDCLKKLANTHYLIHFHPNNCCGIINYNGINIPNVFECTYVRKDLCTNIRKNNLPIPDPQLDVKNTSNDDIYLNGYPFTE